MAAPMSSTHRRHESIMGLDVRTAHPCRCGGGILRVCPHSKVSNVLIWKCSWCEKRRGKPTADEVEALVAFTDQYGWNMQPLRFDESTGAFHV
jgi:hypothetical protein